jgi:tetratricopeptide (TPR) repeat protein
MTQQDQQTFLQAFHAYNAADYPRAIEILRQMEWTLGEHPDVLHLLGSSLSWWGRPEEGREYLKRAVELNPASAQAWADLGHTYTLSGQFDEAHKAIDRGLAARQDHPGALRAKVQLLQRGGRIEEAYALLQPVMARGANHPNIVLAFAELCRRIGKGEEGTSRLKELITRQNVQNTKPLRPEFQR